MTSLKAALGGVRPPGLYRLTSRSAPATVRRTTESLGWRFFDLDGVAITDKAAFLDAAAQAMAFPSYFGRNWDAFEDMVNDLAWAAAPGYVLLYDHAAPFAQRAPQDFLTALDILRTAAARWQADGTPFYVLVRGHDIDAPAL
ncbi:MAG: barstar family protein [Anaerolineae bacterium]|nr:barstar family protein [Anaerolineae bacterium]